MYAIATVVVAPAVDLLRQAVNALAGANLVAQQGLQAPASWLGPIAYLGPGWVAAIASLCAGAALLLVLQAALAAYKLYLSLKAGVKWW